jgi:hypothetical protein
VKLEEASASYVRPQDVTRPLDNRRIKTFLKKRLREKAQLVTGMTWDQLLNNYYDTFEIVGSPSRGTASLSLRDARICVGMGTGTRYPEIKLGFMQCDLFEQ